MPNEFVARNGVIAQNNSTVSGSLTVTNGVTGSLLGTASYSTTASYAHNTTSASFATNAGTAQTSSYVLNAVSASFATQANTSFTASTADNFTVRGTLNVNNNTLAVNSAVVTAAGRKRTTTSKSNSAYSVGTTIAIGKISNDGYGKTINIKLKCHFCGVIDVLEFTIPEITYVGSTTNWLEVPLTNASAGYGGTRSWAVDVYRQDIGSTSDELYIRARVRGGSICSSGTVYFTIEYDDDVTFTDLTNESSTSTTFNASTAPAGGAVSGWYGMQSFQFPVTNGTGWGTGSQGLFIQNGGNTGIGTDIPAAKLHVNSGFVRVTGTDSDQYFLEGVRTGTSTTLRIYDNSSVVFYDSYNTMHFRANQNGGSGGTILFNGGSVGIGTTSPGSLLQVGGSGATAAATPTAIQLDNSYRNAVGGNTSLKFYLYKNSTETYGIGLNNAGGIEYHSGVANDTGSYQAFYFGNSEKVRFKGNGNVGIGTTTPISRLDVNGDITGRGAFNGYASTTHNLLIDWSAESQVTTLTATNLFFGTNATRRMTIISDGNVGIGTSTPTAKLRVEGATILNGNVSANTTYNGFALNVGGTAYIIGGHVWVNDGYGYANASSVNTGMFPDSTHNITFKNNNTTSVYIKSGGNVGIGTTNPISTLTVQGDINVKYNSTDTNYVYRSFVTAHAAGNRGAILRFGMDDGSFTGMSVENTASSNPSYNSQYIDFKTHEGAVSADTRMRITPTGNVGIGTLTPTGKLHVSQSGNGATSTLILSDNARQLKIGRDQIQSYDLGGSATTLYVNPESNIYMNNTAGITYFGGNVGIGTTNPLYKLHVVGDTNIVGNIYFNSTSTQRAVKKYASTVNLSSAAYTVICNVAGDSLASSVRISLQGTADNTVINVVADILANHSTDILITSQAGIYTVVTLRVISDNNEDFSIEATTNSATTCTTYVEVVPLGDETVTFGGAAQTGASLTHVCRPGINISATGGNDGNFAVSGLGYFGGSLGVGTYGPVAKLHIVGPPAVSSSALPALGFSNSSSVALFTNGDPAYGTLFGTLSSGKGWIQQQRVDSGATAYDLLLQPNGGNVGVGTTNAVYKFYVNGDGGIGAAYFSNSDSTFNSTNTTINSTNITVGNNTTDNVYIGQSTLNVLGGCVGIGTTSPVTKLDVNGNISLAYNSGATDRYILRSYAASHQATDVPNNTSFGVTDGPGYAGGTFVGMNIGGVRNGANTLNNYYIDFSTHEGGVSAGTRMRIAVNGNVGIGTTSPSQKLEVAGAINIPVGNYYKSGNVNIISSDGISNYINIAAVLYLQDVSTVRAVVTAAGNVGIASTAPAYKLDVAGDIRITGNIGVGNGTPTTYRVHSIGGPTRFNYGYSLGDDYSYTISRAVAAANGSYTEIGTIASSGASQYATVEIYHHDCGTIEYSKFELIANYYTGGTTDWVQLPSRTQAHYAGGRNGVVVDARLASTGGNIELRLRSIGGACSTMSVTVKIKSTTALTESTGTGTGATVAGLLGFNLYEFPATTGRFNATSEGLFILGSGNVGIGSTSPGVKLDVNGNMKVGTIVSTSDSTEQIVIRTSTNNDKQLVFGRLTDYAQIFAITQNVGYVPLVLQGGGGNVGIGTTTPNYKLRVQGDIYASSDVIAYSDARAKDNVKTVENALAKVTSLRGVTYTRNDIEDKSTKMGVIAQEVLKVLPEVVREGTDGYYSVAYGNMVGVLIEAIKEQQRQIDELKYLLQTQNK